MSEAKPKFEWPCTECGGDAKIAYSAGKKRGQDWNGKVKAGERLCTRCFQNRGGHDFLNPRRQING